MEYFGTRGRGGRGSRKMTTSDGEDEDLKKSDKLVHTPPRGGEPTFHTVTPPSRSEAPVAEDSKGSSDVLQESTRNLIVNYLPSTLTEEALAQLFSPYGTIENLKIVVDIPTGKSRGFGFVLFEESGSAAAAKKALNGYKTEGKVLKVAYARPQSKEIQNANLYVANLPKHWGRRELADKFRECGIIVDAKVLMNESRRSKGIGFVRMHSHSSALETIQRLNGSTPKDGSRPLIVKLAQRKNDETTRKKPERSFHGAHGGAHAARRHSPPVSGAGVRGSRSLRGAQGGERRTVMKPAFGARGSRDSTSAHTPPRPRQQHFVPKRYTSPAPRTPMHHTTMLKDEMLMAPPSLSPTTSSGVGLTAAEVLAPLLSPSAPFGMPASYFSPSPSLLRSQIAHSLAMGTFVDDFAQMCAQPSVPLSTVEGYFGGPPHPHFSAEAVDFDPFHGYGYVPALAGSLLYGGIREPSLTPPPFLASVASVLPPSTPGGGFPLPTTAPTPPPLMSQPQAAIRGMSPGLYLAATRGSAMFAPELFERTIASAASSVALAGLLSPEPPLLPLPSPSPVKCPSVPLLASPRPRVLVRNIPSTFTTDDLIVTFVKYGLIDSVKIERLDGVSPIGPVTGTVTFMCEADAMKALQENGQVVDGKYKLEVFLEL